MELYGLRRDDYASWSTFLLITNFLCLFGQSDVMIGMVVRYCTGVVCVSCSFIHACCLFPQLLLRMD